MSSPLIINTRELSQINLISEAHLMSRVHAVTWDHLRSLIQPAAMMVHVTTRNHVDGCGLFCHRTAESTLLPDVMLMSLYGQCYYRKLYWSPWFMSPMKVIWCLRPCWYALSILISKAMLIPVVLVYPGAVLMSMLRLAASSHGGVHGLYQCCTTLGANL